MSSQPVVASGTRGPGALRTALSTSLVVLWALASITVFVLLFMVDEDDVLRAWKNPPRYELVQRRMLPRSSFSEDAARASGDFDGDGVDDHLTSSFLRREPLFAESTLSMVYVHSGAGALLLAHPTRSPWPQVHWAGDLDGDGRDEIVVQGDSKAEDWIAFSFRRR